MTKSCALLFTCDCSRVVILPGPEVIFKFSCSFQLSMKFILLIDVKMPTIICILTYISMDNIPSAQSLKDRICLNISAFYFLYAVEISCSAELSMKFFLKYRGSLTNLNDQTTGVI